MKKELFVEAELEISLFEATDVITTSNVLDEEDDFSGAGL